MTSTFYKTDTFPRQPVKSISKVAVLHRFHCTIFFRLFGLNSIIHPLYVYLDKAALYRPYPSTWTKQQRTVLIHLLALAASYCYYPSIWIKRYHTIFPSTWIKQYRTVFISQLAAS